MSDSITFQGQLWRVTQDHEGESRITFAIPLSDLEKVLKIGSLTQRRLTVTVEADQ